MLAIAGAILIHAACVLMASGKATFETDRILMVVGFFLVVSDLTIRVREFFRKA